jgi:hypothetical protein
MSAGDENCEGGVDMNIDRGKEGTSEARGCPGGRGGYPEHGGVVEVAGG